MTNSRQCSTCKELKHLKWFPLVYPDDPDDFRRLPLCEPCAKAAMRIVKKTPVYKAYKKALGADQRLFRATVNNAYRRAAELQAMPFWADRDRINAIYRLAKKLTKSSGIRYEVDHIIPLVHPHVCGLHVHHNLQILTKSENSRKSNRVNDELPAMRALKRPSKVEESRPHG